MEKWVELAQELFPESMYTRLDIEYALFARSWNENDYAGCVERGERYLKAMEDFRAGKDPTDIGKILPWPAPVSGFAAETPVRPSRRTPLPGGPPVFGWSTRWNVT